MSHLKRYGMYLVFGGMATTGAFVWDSYRTDLNAASYAEIYNAAMERLVVARLTGTDQPDWTPDVGDPTNLFPSALLTKDFRDRMLAKSRDAALLSTPLGAGEVDPEILWLLSTNAIYDGSASLVTNFTGVASSTATEDGRSVTRYETCLSSNFVDGAMTSHSVWRPGSLDFPAGAPMTNQPLPGMLFNSPTGRRDGFSFFFPAEGCAWNTNRGSVAFTFYGLQKPLDRVFRRRDLVGPADALSNLTVTIRALAPPSVTGTNLNTGSNVSYESPTEVSPGAYLAECHGSTTNGAPYSLFKWVYGFDYRCQQLYDEDPAPEWLTSHTFYKSIEKPTALLGSMEYPSAYAVTNGYVSRIQVFGVFSQFVDINEPWVESPLFDPYVVFDPHYAATLSEFGGVSFGAALSFTDYSAFDRTPELSAPGMPLSLYTPHYSPVLALLYDKAGPTSTNDLLWSAITLPELTVSAAPSAYWKTGITNAPAEDLTLFSSLEYDYGGTVTITPEKLLVVVTWTWRHLNKNNPYVPPE